MPVLTACLSVRVSTGGRAIDSLASYLPRDPSLLTFVRLQHLLCSPPKAGSARGNCERSPSEERWLFSFLLFLYFSTAKNQGKGHQEKKKEREREAKLQQRLRNAGAGLKLQVSWEGHRSQTRGFTAHSLPCGNSHVMKSCDFLPCPCHSPEFHVRDTEPWMLKVFFISKSPLSSASSPSRGC